MGTAFPISLHVPTMDEEAERTLVRFLKDYLADTNRKGYVLGLSGGLDSAVVAALSARAAGPDRTHVFFMPDAASSKHDEHDAEAVAKQLGLRLHRLGIQPLLDAFTSQIPKPKRAVLSNAKARARMILLNAEAMGRDCLVLGTGNKSELLTGYFTKWGDGGVDIQPLGDLYKTQVRSLATRLEISPSILEKPPSAGLFEGQTDEAELGIAYAVLDRILLGLEVRLDKKKIAEIVGVRPAEVERIERIRSQTQHKRRSPMIPKMGLRTVGLDWRTPTLEG